MSNAPSPAIVQRAAIPDAARTLAEAFADDPVWSWVLDDDDRRFEQFRRLLILFLEGALAYEWVRSTPAGEAVALWIPPGCAELPAPYAARLEPLVEELVGERAPFLNDVFECFEATHPHEEAHFYLSFLGTGSAHRGQGIGMHLLRANLAEIDAAHQPAYLESTNPANVERYESIGFVRTGEFRLPGNGPSVTGMWRPAAPRG